MTSSELMTLNGISDARNLQVGQVLQVNGSASVAAPPVLTTFPEPVADEVVPANAPTVSTLPIEVDGPVEIRSVEGDPVDLSATTVEEPDLDFDSTASVPVTRLQD
jgi:LysM repeat protein